MALLEIKGVTKSFGGLTAVHAVDMEVEQGQIVGLIGPNGAGKTTLFNCIAGHYPPDAGEIWFQGERIDGLSPDAICKKRLVRTFQIVKILAKLTVLENVMVGAFLRDKNVARARKRAWEILAICNLSHLANVRGAALTIGNKKRVEVARTLATDPTLILFDEVMAGLTPKESQEAIDLVHRVREMGITVLMVEHVMEIIMPISERIVVLDYGKKIAEGTSEEIVKNEQVINAYLGVKP